MYVRPAVIAFFTPGWYSKNKLLYRKEGICVQSFQELAARRESCRSYSARPVEPEKLEAVVRTACLSPSACNSQPWHFSVVTSPELLPQVASCVQLEGLNGFASGCPAFLVVGEVPAQLMRRLRDKVDSQHFASIDIGLAAAHLCLAAADLGLGTCIMGMFDEARLKALLDWPEKLRVRLVIAVGYPSEDGARPKARKPFGETVRFYE